MRYKIKGGDTYIYAMKIKKSVAEDLSDLNAFIGNESFLKVYYDDPKQHIPTVTLDTANGSNKLFIGQYVVRSPESNLLYVMDGELFEELFEEAPPKKKAMLSQPMRGRTDEEIVETRNRAIKALEDRGFEIVNTLFTDEYYSALAMNERGVENAAICYLAKSIENMSLCHAAYFCAGWQDMRGCKIEHEVAKKYGLEIIYEDESSDPDKQVATSEYLSNYPVPGDLMRFYRDKWEDFVKFTNGLARNLTMERRPNGACTCSIFTRTGVLTLNEGDCILKCNDGHMYYCRKDEREFTKFVPKGE